LNERGKAVNGSRVHVAGIAYKRNIDDIRESPALDIILLLEKKGATVTYSDPFVPKLKLDGLSLESERLLDRAKRADCVLIVTDHSQFNYKGLLDSAKLIVDTRNAMKGFLSERIVRL